MNSTAAVCRVGLVVGGLLTFCGCGTSTVDVSSENGEQPAVRTAIGDIVSLSRPSTCAPTFKSGVKILSATQSGRSEFLRVVGEESKSAGWPGPIFLDSSNRLKVVDNSSPSQTRVQIVDAQFEGLLNDNQKRCWVPAGAIRGGQLQPEATVEVHGYSTALAVSKIIKTQSDFDQSEFCMRYRCRKGVRHSVSTDFAIYEYETSVEHLGVDLTVQVSTSNVTSLGLAFYERDQLSSGDFDVIRALIRSSNQGAEHIKTMSFIKDNVEVALCRACSVPKDAKSVIDGEFRISAGKSGNPVVTIDRVAR